MNQRIRELAEQSTEKIHRFSYSLGHRTETFFDREKFAELIVRKCMDIAREVGTSTEPEDFALDRCYEIETKIKEHFGVEP